MAKFKKGDIVISLIDQATQDSHDNLPIKKGDIDKIADVGLDNKRKCLWFKKTSSGNYTVSNFRYATPDEQEAFMGGITNIEDIKEQGLNIVGRWVQARYDDPVGICSWKKYDYRKIVKYIGEHYHIDNGFTFKNINFTDGIVKLMPKDFELPITATKKWEPKVGKWYKTIGDQFVTNKYIKYVMTNHTGAIIFKERVTQKGEYQVFSEHQSTSISRPHDTLVEVPDSEVAQYIPKVDSYIPKVGDWIVITKGGNWSSSMDKFVGNCVKISIVTSDGNSIKFPGCETWSWFLNNNHFRPALEHERPVVNDTSSEILVDRGDWIIFNNTGGSCGNAQLYISKPYRLIERSYKSKGVHDIDWTIEDAEGNQPRVRLKDASKYHYDTYWRKCTFDEIPGSKLIFQQDIDIPTYKSKRVLPGILPQVMNRTDVHQALILGLI